jgi:hypothetical protein
MPLQTASILSGPTASFSGGSALVFTAKSVGSDEVVLMVPADTDFRTRRTVTAKVSAPKVSSGAPNGYTQARNQMTLRFPRVLANGKYTVDTMRIELARDVETSEANVAEMLLQAGQALLDTDFTSYWKQQSLL